MNNDKIIKRLDNLRKLREQKNITQTAFAYRMGTGSHYHRLFVFIVVIRITYFTYKNKCFCKILQKVLHFLDFFVF